MKKIILVNLLAATFIVSACKVKKKKELDQVFKFPSELVDFTPSNNNPLFTGTGKETWDSSIRERGYILKEDGIYKMWYTGYDGIDSSVKHLGYATSSDGIEWTRYPENPIFEEYWTEDVHVLKHNDAYYIVAEGINDVSHMLTSPDGINWQSLGDLDIRMVNGDPIKKGAYGTPTLWVENDIWYLFYERGDLGIWLAKSKDRKVWTNIQDEPVIEMGPEKYDIFGVAINQIVKHKGKYYAYYHATPDEDWTTWNSNAAVSDDLIHWTKYENNPIFTTVDDDTNISSPILVHDGDKYRLYTMHDKVRVYFPNQ